MSERSFRRENQRRIAAAKRREFKRAKRAAAATVAAGAFVLAAPAVSSASTFVVNATTDTGGTTCAPDPADPTTPTCELRDAIAAAAANAGADTITFDSSISGDTITLDPTKGPLVVNDNAPLTIYGGPTPDSIYIDGGYTGSGDTDGTQVFYAQNTYYGGSTPGLTFSGLTIQNGKSTNAPSPYTTSGTDNFFGNGRAGGIDAGSGNDVLLTNTTVTGNIGDPSHTFASGGGIYAGNGTNLAVTNNSTVSNNDGSAAGGIYAGQNADATVSDSTVSGNTAEGARVSPSFGGFPPGAESGAAGGGITNRGQMTVSNTEVSGNHSAPSNACCVPYVGYGGGGVDNLGQATISGSTIDGNDANASGGGVFQGFTKYQGHYGNTYVSLTIDGGTVISNNQADNMGGGVSSALALKYANSHSQIQDTTITGNTSGTGAGIGIGYLAVGDHWTVTHSTISNNNAYDGRGGGVFLGYVAGLFNLEDSTISGNNAGEGGGAYLSTGAQQQPDAVQFNNSTIASNAALYAGGGIYRDFGYYDAKQPAAKNSRAAAYVVNPIQVTSTIVGDNTANGAPNDLEDDNPTDGGGFDLSFSLVENQGNSAITETPAGSNIFGQDPQLGPLQNNGGLTDTELPSINSPVVDKGKAPARLLTDQRGDPRTVDTSVANAADGTDIGSVELPTGPPAPPNAGGSLGTKIHNVKKKHKKRRRIIRTHHNSVKIHLTFNSPIAGATFTCSVDGGAFEPCTSPFSVRLKSAPDPGAKHSITIVTRDANGNQLGQPKTFKFRIIKI